MVRHANANEQGQALVEWLMGLTLLIPLGIGGLSLLITHEHRLFCLARRLELLPQQPGCAKIRILRPTLEQWQDSRSPKSEEIRL